MQENPLLIIDGDIVLFQIGRVCEDITDFDGQIMESFDEEASIRLLESELNTIATMTGYNREDIIFAISDDVNFRKEHFPTYKSNRKDIRKPLGLKFIREYLKENKEKYNLLMLERLEADDCMGILGTSGDTRVSIYSQDKDLRTIPVRQWNFKKKKFIVPDQFEACRFLYTQVLTGDAVDGYKGCPKIGKKKASEALKDLNEEVDMLEAVHKMYFKVYKEQAKEKVLEQIGQAKILHHSDFIKLMNEDKTYDPYEALGVTDEMLRLWQGM